MTTLDREAFVDRIPMLRQRGPVEELSGGLTNVNYLVESADGERVVVRRWHGDAALLGIDRAAERDNTDASHRAGVGPAVLDYRDEPGALVIEHLPGRTLTDADFTDVAVLRRAARAVRTLNDGPAFTGRFDMLSRRDDYLATVRREGFDLPERYEDFEPHWRRLRDALRASPQPLVPCNNDLLAGNFIDDGERVRLIDYEYSGMNEAAFEVGNTTTECEFDEDMTAAYVAAYLGRDTLGPEDTPFHSRVRAQAVVSAYGWALWGFIQHGSSTIEEDFWGWGEHRFEKAARVFSSAGFDAMLEDLTP